MRNVTITLDEETARWARVEAAKRDTSVSRYVGELLRQHMVESEEYERARRSFASRGPVELSSGRPYPTRDEVHRR